MTKLFSTLCLAITALFILSCENGSSSTTDLTTEQVAAINSAFSGAISDSGGSTFKDPTTASTESVDIDTNSMTFSCNQTTLRCTGTPNGTYNCAGGGHITYTGNITVACTIVHSVTYNGVTVYSCTGDWVTSASLVFQLSDPTNNLNDCNVGNGLILDGNVKLMMSGTNAKINTSITGTIALMKRGETGGLKSASDSLISSDCNIFVYIPSGEKPTGTICGKSISSASLLN